VNLNITKITYLLRGGRRDRLAEPGQGPTEFFYGYQQLLALGVDVSILEDSDVGMAPPLPAWSRLANKLSPLLGGFPVGMALSLLAKHGCRKLDGAGCVVATTNGMGMALALTRALGRLRAPVLLIAMGLLPHNAGKLQVWLYQRLAHNIRIACLSRGEEKFLRGILVGQTISYVPFGVDHCFWHPAPCDAAEEPFVLAVGNDLNRDWATLVKAWSPDLPRLKIITCLHVPVAQSNVEVIRGDWRTSELSDEELRKLYWSAAVVVVPLKETIQPSGQSSCLQAMACRKSVVITETEGLWDRELILNEQNVLLVPPGDAAALNLAVRRLLASPTLRQSLGRQARGTIEKHFNADIMATSIYNLLAQDHG
jgi:glycosyltransferase involved in cell wall biosynthesis